MRNIFLLLVLIFNTQLVYGSAGIYDAGLIVGGTTYYESGFSFNGRSFSITQGNALDMTFAFVKTFKNGGSDVCSARMNYSVYLAGGSPSFTTVNLPFGQDFGSGDQQWNATFSVNLASGLSPGNYKIAIYYDATAGGAGCSSPFPLYFNNGGANYIADLTVDIPLPVQLQSFRVEKADHDVFLDWATATETDCQYFQVEHQTAGQDWFVLGRINAKGNSTVHQAYHFTHRNPSNGLHYYRLLQLDFAGKTTYSPIVSIDFQSGTPIVLSPNPLSGNQLNIRLPAAENTRQMRLYNVQGTLLKSWNVDTSAGEWIQVDISTVPAGLLFLQVGTEKPLQLIRE